MQHLHPAGIIMSSRLQWPHSHAAGVAHLQLAAARHVHHHIPVLVHVCLACLWATHIVYNQSVQHIHLKQLSRPAGCSGGFMALMWIPNPRP